MNLSNTNYSRKIYTTLSFILTGIILSWYMYANQQLFQQQPQVQPYSYTQEYTQEYTEQFNVNVTNFQAKIINPVLLKMHLYSLSASNLLLGTAIQETLLGKLSKNMFQIEAWLTAEAY